MPVLWAIFAVLFGVVTLAAPAQADNRVALVIGNSAYVNTAPLANPGNDVGDIAAALDDLSRGDAASAGARYEEITARWRVIASLEHAN